MKQKVYYAEKHPDAEISLQVDWTAYQTRIGSPGITSSTWEDAAGVLTFSGETETDGVTFAIAAGGADGTTYRVRNWVTFANGVQDNFDWLVIVDDKVN